MSKRKRPGESGSRTYKDEDMYPCPGTMQEEEDDIVFESILDKKKRTVRLMRIGALYLEVIDKNTDILLSPKSYQEFYIYLCKLYAGFHSIAKRVGITFGAAIVPESAAKADEDIIREALFVNRQVFKKLEAKGKDFSCPERHDLVFQNWCELSHVILRMHNFAVERRPLARPIVGCS